VHARERNRKCGEEGDIFVAFGTLHTTSQNPFEFELFAFLLQQLRAHWEPQIIKEDGEEKFK